MPRRRRFFQDGQVLFVTHRTNEGLPFVPHRFMKAIIFGILARAQAKYGLEICHFIFLGNHYHMIVICQADSIDKAMEYINGEIAKCINRLRGVRHRSVWASRYKAQPILGASDVVRKIVDLYSNPVSADLVEYADLFLGASSWEFFRNDSYERECPWIKSSYITELSEGELDDPFITDHLLRLVEESHTLQVSPYAWTRCFPESQALKNTEIKQQIERGLSERAAVLRERRERNGRVVLGIEQLRKQSFFKPFQQEKRGRSSLCISSDSARREDFEREFSSFNKRMKRSFSPQQDRSDDYKFGPNEFVLSVLST